MQSARFFVWEPLAGQARPVKRMSYHKIVEIWGVLLPVETCTRKFLPERVRGDSYHILYSYS